MAAHPQPYPRVGVGVFVCRAPDGGATRFVLGKRKGSHGAGTWSLPGGHLELHETFTTCAAREVVEETGLRLEGPSVRFLTATESFFDGGAHYVTVFIAARVEGRGPQEPENLEPDKCEGWIWTSFEEMRELGSRGSEALFQPLRDLMVQRPDVCARLERGEGG